MSSAPATGHYVIDEEEVVLVSTVGGAEYKAEQETITGYVATNGTDKVNDRFTKDALKDIARQIKADIETVDAYFSNIDEDKLEELEQYDSTVGNANHNNNPLFERMGLGDPRIVPAFKIVDAKYVEESPVSGISSGVKITAELNTKGNPDDVSTAIRESIKGGFVDSLSIEYKAKETETRVINGETIRLLKSVIVNGAGVTGRPANEEAKLTNFSLKSLLGDDTDNNAMGDNDPDRVTQDDLEEVKSDFEGRIDDLEEKNESLHEENNELKAKLEDLETLEEVKGDIDDLRDDLGDVKNDVEPLKKKGSSKFDSELEEYLVKTVEHASPGHVQEHKSMIAQDHGVSEETVEETLESIKHGDD